MSRDKARKQLSQQLRELRSGRAPRQALERVWFTSAAIWPREAVGWEGHLTSGVRQVTAVDPRWPARLSEKVNRSGERSRGEGSRH